MKRHRSPGQASADATSSSASWDSEYTTKGTKNTNEGYRVDVFVENRLIIELKAVDKVLN